MNITCLIIDDEPLARRQIKDLLKDWQEFNIIGECGDGQDAILKINTLNPNVIFLDIEIKGMTGFDVINEMTNKPTIIFTTAYDQFALKSYDVFAFDFILKPISKERFDICIKRLVSKFKLENQLKSNIKIKNALSELISDQVIEKKKNEKLPIKFGKKTIFIKTLDIMYILASGSYSELQLIDRKLLLRESLLHFNENLDYKDFLRIHRSTIVNVNYITEIIRSDYNEIDVKIDNGKLFRVSRARRKFVIERLGL